MSKVGQIQSLSASQSPDDVSGYQAKEFGYIILKHWRPILRWFLRRPALP